MIGNGRGVSDHLALEAEAALKRGRPLEPDEPVPGCSCDWCVARGNRPSGALGNRPPVRRAPRRRRRRGLALDVDAAKRVDILAVAGSLGIEARLRSGKGVMANCPLHEDRRPSLYLSPADGLFFCHACGAGGDAIELVQRVTGTSFREAVERLTRDAA